ncbi:leucine-rich repeat-containing protein Bf66946-like [Branchiostoma floridae x Branchiostoma japonicum]
MSPDTALPGSEGETARWRRGRLAFASRPSLPTAFAVDRLLCKVLTCTRRQGYTHRMYVWNRLRLTAMVVQECCFLLFSLFVLAETDEPDCPPPCSCSDQYGELVVSCGGQGIARIPEHIPASVTWLDLKYNNITKVTSKSFKDITQVKGINLSHNRIRKISADAFKNLKHLDNLDLSQNMLKTISYDLFKLPIDSAVKDARNFFVDLAMNPWLCDCSLAWLTEMFRNGSHMFSSRLVTCDGPEALKGVDVKDVSLSTFLCPIATIAPTEVKDNSTYHFPLASGRHASRLPVYMIAPFFVVLVLTVALALLVKRCREKMHPPTYTCKYKKMPHMLSTGPQKDGFV